MQRTSSSEALLRFAVLATDTVLFTVRNGKLLVRLVRVQRPPHFPDHKGLPGGLLQRNETAQEAAVRHLTDKAKMDAQKIYFEQVYTFSNVDRDPRGRVVAVAYLGLIPWESLSISEQSDNADVWWEPVQEARKLAYDHDEILSVALARLRARVTYTTLISRLMPKAFTLTELEQMYESILKTSLDKRNFRKKIQKLEILSALPHKKSGGPYRPAQLYKFASQKVSYIEVL